MLQYEKAGVSIRAGEDLVAALKQSNTFIGGFAGIYPLDELRSLVACTDGVGTKLEISQKYEKYKEIGQDLVAMSVNDLIVCGARPLFFLDYYATGKLDVAIAKEVIGGIQTACSQSQCVLLGGETAEMPGFYQGHSFDLAGFAVGEVMNADIIDGSKIVAGDCIVGLPSSGFHANGYSLVRHLIKEHNIDLSQMCPGATVPLHGALTEPTCLYVNTVRTVLKSIAVKGMVHITGGGLSNMSRVIPQGLTYDIHKAAIPLPAVISYFKNIGRVSDAECYQVWNMGLGFAFILDATEAKKILDSVPESFVAGKIVDLPLL